MDEHETVRWDRDDDGIVVLTLDDPRRSANVIDDAYVASMGRAVDRLEAERDSVAGVVLTSAKRTFSAGGDLDDLLAAGRDDVPRLTAHVREVKAQLRRLETLGRPVVAAINGAALGGGLEIALAAHHRVVVDDPGAVLGFPEVRLGLLPGAGGVVRSVRTLGIADALTKLLLDGERLDPAAAHELGLAGEIVPAVADLLPAARRWIAANPEAVQPWDTAGYRMPGGTPASPGLAAVLPSFPANLRKRLKGANYPAPHHIMAAAVEGAQVDFDNALEIEGRYFVNLATGQVAKNMIQAFLARQGGKAPSAVDDSQDFTRRTIGARVAEALAMVEEGVPAASIEQASAQAGYRAPVLALADEVEPGPRRAGSESHVGGASGDVPFEDLEQRLLFAEALEAVGCIDEGVVATPADANAGSLHGAGFPGWTGGVLQYIDGFDGGVVGFVARARELAARYGDRFEPPASLVS